MKRPAARLAVLLALATVALAATAGGAAARGSCGEKVLDDWYGGHLGKKIYALHCYRDALNIVKGETDISVYSNARQEILLAMQAAIAAGKDKGGGSGPDVTGDITTADALPSFVGGPDAKNGGHSPSASEPDTIRPRKVANQGPIADALKGSSASSVPLPAIVLGAIAALLLALGSAAYLTRRRQQRRQTFRPRHANGRNPG